MRQHLEEALTLYFQNVESIPNHPMRAFKVSMHQWEFWDERTNRMWGMRCVLFPALSLLTYLLMLGYRSSASSIVQEAIEARTTDPIIQLPQQMARAVTYVTAETTRLNEERHRHDTYFANHSTDWTSWNL